MVPVRSNDLDQYCVLVLDRTFCVMADKKKRKPKELPKVVPAKPETGNRAEDAEDEGRMDFGGLPARDLKKNLGCG